MGFLQQVDAMVENGGVCTSTLSSDVLEVVSPTDLRTRILFQNIRRSLLDPDFLNPWTIEAVHFVNNAQLTADYEKKKLEFAEIGEDASEIFTFQCMRDWAQANQVAHQGLVLSSFKAAILGSNDTGVHTTKHADVQLKIATERGVTQPILAVFKGVLGKSLVVDARAQGCTIPIGVEDTRCVKTAAVHHQPLIQQFINSQIYFCCINQPRARHIIPFAMIKMSKPVPPRLMSIPVTPSNLQTVPSSSGNVTYLQNVPTQNGSRHEMPQTVVRPLINTHNLLQTPLLENLLANGDERQASTTQGRTPNQIGSTRASGPDGITRLSASGALPSNTGPGASVRQERLNTARPQWPTQQANNNPRLQTRAPSANQRPLLQIPAQTANHRPLLQTQTQTANHRLRLPTQVPNASNRPRLQTHVSVANMRQGISPHFIQSFQRAVMMSNVPLANQRPGLPPPQRIPANQRAQQPSQHRPNGNDPAQYMQVRQRLQFALGQSNHRPQMQPQRHMSQSQRFNVNTRPQIPPNILNGIRQRMTLVQNPRPAQTTNHSPALQRHPGPSSGEPGSRRRSQGSGDMSPSHEIADRMFRQFNVNTAPLPAVTMRLPVAVVDHIQEREIACKSPVSESLIDVDDRVLISQSTAGHASQSAVALNSGNNTPRGQSQDNAQPGTSGETSNFMTLLSDKIKKLVTEIESPPQAPSVKVKEADLAEASGLAEQDNNHNQSVLDRHADQDISEGRTSQDRQRIRHKSQDHQDLLDVGDDHKGFEVPLDESAGLSGGLCGKHGDEGDPAEGRQVEADVCLKSDVSGPGKRLAPDVSHADEIIPSKSRKRSIWHTYRPNRPNNRCLDKRSQNVSAPQRKTPKGQLGVKDVKASRRKTGRDESVMTSLSEGLESDSSDKQTSIPAANKKRHGSGGASPVVNKRRKSQQHTTEENILETVTESQPPTVSVTESQPPTVTESQPQTVTESQPKTVSVTESQPQTVTESQPKTVNVTESQPPTVTESQPKTVSVTESQPPTVTKSKPQTVTESQSQTVTARQSQSATEIQNTAATTAEMYDVDEHSEPTAKRSESVVSQKKELTPKSGNSGIARELLSRLKKSFKLKGLSPAESNPGSEMITESVQRTGEPDANYQSQNVSVTDTSQNVQTDQEKSKHKNSEPVTAASHMNVSIETARYSSGNVTDKAVARSSNSTSGNITADENIPTHVTNSEFILDLTNESDDSDIEFVAETKPVSSNAATSGELGMPMLSAARVQDKDVTIGNASAVNISAAIEDIVDSIPSSDTNAASHNGSNMTGSTNDEYIDINHLPERYLFDNCDVTNGCPPLPKSASNVTNGNSNSKVPDVTNHSSALVHEKTNSASAKVRDSTSPVTMTTKVKVLPGQRSNCEQSEDQRTERKMKSNHSENMTSTRNVINIHDKSGSGETDCSALDKVRGHDNGSDSDKVRGHDNGSDSDKVRGHDYCSASDKENSQKGLSTPKNRKPQRITYSKKRWYRCFYDMRFQPYVMLGQKVSLKRRVKISTRPQHDQPNVRANLTNVQVRSSSSDSQDQRLQPSSSLDSQSSSEVDVYSSKSQGHRRKESQTVLPSTSLNSSTTGQVEVDSSQGQGQTMEHSLTLDCSTRGQKRGNPLLGHSGGQTAMPSASLESSSSGQVDGKSSQVQGQTVQLSGTLNCAASSKSAQERKQYLLRLFQRVHSAQSSPREAPQPADPVKQASNCVNASQNLVQNVQTKNGSETSPSMQTQSTKQFKDRISPEVTSAVNREIETPRIMRTCSANVSNNENARQHSHCTDKRVEEDASVEEDAVPENCVSNVQEKPKEDKNKSDVITNGCDKAPNSKVYSSKISDNSHEENVHRNIMDGNVHKKHRSHIEESKVYESHEPSKQALEGSFSRGNDTLSSKDISPNSSDVKLHKNISSKSCVGKRFYYEIVSSGQIQSQLNLGDDMKGSLRKHCESTPVHHENKSENNTYITSSLKSNPNIGNVKQTVNDITKTQRDIHKGQSPSMCAKSKSPMSKAASHGGKSSEKLVKKSTTKTSEASVFHSKKNSPTEVKRILKFTKDTDLTPSSSKIPSSLSFSGRKHGQLSSSFEEDDTLPDIPHVPDVAYLPSVTPAPSSNPDDVAQVKQDEKKISSVIESASTSGRSIIPKKRCRIQKRIRFVGRYIHHAWITDEKTKQTEWFKGKVLSCTQGKDGMPGSTYRVRYAEDNDPYMVDHLYEDYREGSLKFLNDSSSFFSSLNKKIVKESLKGRMKYHIKASRQRKKRKSTHHASSRFVKIGKKASSRSKTSQSTNQTTNKSVTESIVTNGAAEKPQPPTQNINHKSVTECKGTSSSREKSQSTPRTPKMAVDVCKQANNEKFQLTPQMPNKTVNLCPKGNSASDNTQFVPRQTMNSVVNVFKEVTTDSENSSSTQTNASDDMHKEGSTDREMSLSTEYKDASTDNASTLPSSHAVLPQTGDDLQDMSQGKAAGNVNCPLFQDCEKVTEELFDQYDTNRETLTTTSSLEGIESINSAQCKFDSDLKSRNETSVTAVHGNDRSKSPEQIGKSTGISTNNGECDPLLRKEFTTSSIQENKALTSRSVESTACSNDYDIESENELVIDEDVASDSKDEHEAVTSRSLNTDIEAMAAAYRPTKPISDADTTSKQSTTTTTAAATSYAAMTSKLSTTTTNADTSSKLLTCTNAATTCKLSTRTTINAATTSELSTTMNAAITSKLSNTTTNEATSKLLTTNAATTSKLSTTNAATTSKLSTTNAATTSKLSTTNAATASKLSTTNAATTSKLSTTNAATISKLSTTNAATTSKLSTTNAATTSKLSTTNAATISKLSTTNAATTSKLSTTNAATTSKLSTTNVATASKLSTTKAATTSKLSTNAATTSKLSTTNTAITSKLSTTTDAVATSNPSKISSDATTTSNMSNTIVNAATTSKPSTKTRDVAISSSKLSKTTTDSVTIRKPSPITDDAAATSKSPTVTTQSANPSKLSNKVLGKTSNFSTTSTTSAASSKPSTKVSINTSKLSSMTSKSATTSKLSTKDSDAAITSKVSTLSPKSVVTSKLSTTTSDSATASNLSTMTSNLVTSSKILSADSACSKVSCKTTRTTTSSNLSTMTTKSAKLPCVTTTTTTDSGITLKPSTKTTKAITSNKPFKRKIDSATTSRPSTMKKDSVTSSKTSTKKIDAATTSKLSTRESLNTIKTSTVTTKSATTSKLSTMITDLNTSCKLSTSKIDSETVKTQHTVRTGVPENEQENANEKCSIEQGTLTVSSISNSLTEKVFKDDPKCTRSSSEKVISPPLQRSEKRDPEPVKLSVSTVWDFLEKEIFSDSDHSSSEALVSSSEFSEASPVKDSTLKKVYNTSKRLSEAVKEPSHLHSKGQIKAKTDCNQKPFSSKCIVDSQSNSSTLMEISKKTPSSVSKTPELQSKPETSKKTPSSASKTSEPKPKSTQSKIKITLLSKPQTHNPAKVKPSISSRHQARNVSSSQTSTSALPESTSSLHVPSESLSSSSSSSKVLSPPFTSSSSAASSQASSASAKASASLISAISCSGTKHTSPLCESTKNVSHNAKTLSSKTLSTSCKTNTGIKPSTSHAKVNTTTKQLTTPSSKHSLPTKISLSNNTNASKEPIITTNKYSNDSSSKTAITSKSAQTMSKSDKKSASSSDSTKTASESASKPTSGQVSSHHSDGRSAKATSSSSSSTDTDIAVTTASAAPSAVHTLSNSATPKGQPTSQSGQPNSSMSSYSDDTTLTGKPKPLESSHITNNQSTRIQLSPSNKTNNASGLPMATSKENNPSASPSATSKTLTHPVSSTATSKSSAAISDDALVSALVAKSNIFQDDNIASLFKDTIEVIVNNKKE